MRKTLVAATGIALAMVAGCSSDKGGGAPATPGAAPGGKDTCSLVSDDQLTKAFGQKPNSHQASNDITNGCKWLFPNDNASLHIYLAKSGDISPRMNDKGQEPVSGVGDKAVWSTDAGVMFATGGSYGLQVIVGVGVSNAGSAEHKDREKQAGISVTRNAFAGLGIGKPDDQTIPGPSVTSTSPTTSEPSETSSPEPPTTEPTSSDDSNTDTSEPEPSEPSGN
jgi:hypothetical protein